VVDTVSEVPPSIQTAIGNVLFNLRSALDHLACQLVIANGGVPEFVTPPLTAFPVWAERLTQNGGIKDLRIAGGVSPQVLAKVEGLQPYNRPDDPTLDPLWILTELNNIDKHRLLLVVGLAFDRPVYTTRIGTESFPWDPTMGQAWTPRPLLPGAFLFSVGRGKNGKPLVGEMPPWLPPDTKLEVEVTVDLRPRIAFGEGEVCAGKAVSDVLDQLKQTVEAVVTDLAQCT
jgi:hypothetical protein